MQTSTYIKYANEWLFYNFVCCDIFEVTHLENAPFATLVVQQQHNNKHYLFINNLNLLTICCSFLSS